MKRILLVLAAVAGIARGADWTIDQAHSTALFTVTHMMVSHVNGWFGDFSGTMTTPGSDIAGGQLEVTIKTASLSTANDKRDAHLRSADFFDVTKFPVAAFKSTAITKNADGTYRIDGMLTIHGVTKPVTLQARKTGEIKDPQGNERMGFTASTTIDRYDFGLTWNKSLEAGGMLVSRNVDLTFNVEWVGKPAS